MIDLTKERPLSLKRAAAFVGVHQRTVERWIATGGLDSVRIGGKVYTSRSALQRFASVGSSGQANERRQSAADEAADRYLDDLGVH